MALLLKSNIEKKVHDKIRGDVARIGGSINQIVDFKNCKVTDINLIDGGFGDIKQWNNIKSIKHLLKTAKRYAKQKFLHLRYGEKICRDWKTKVLDIHEAYKHKDLKHKFDACVSSNVLEHSPNPVFFLLNLYFITKKEGHQFHAIPHYKYTYDMYRKPTAVEHMIEDFRRKTWTEDIAHNEDYIQSAIVKHGYFKKYHETHPISYPFMHFHVFDENNIRKLCETIFEEVINDILKTKTISDNVIIFKNKLNKNFVDKHKKIILEYSKDFLSH